jgi:hypothetical protein
MCLEKRSTNFEPDVNILKSSIYLLSKSTFHIIQCHNDTCSKKNFNRKYHHIITLIANVIIEKN